MSRTLITSMISLVLGGLLFVVWLLSLPPTPSQLSHASTNDIGYMYKSQI